MSMWSRLFRAEARAMVPSGDSPRWGIGPQWLQWRVPSDLYMSPEDQLSVSVAWGCVRAIVDPIAASEIKVYEDRDGQRTEEEEWLYHLLNVAPHPDYTSQGWSEAVITGAVATPIGGFAYINRDGLGRASSLQPLDPLRMSADEVGGRVLYVYADPVNGRVEIPPSEMIHVRGPRRMAGFYPDSPLARASAALALARAQEQYATSYYANGAYPGLLLKPPAEMRGAPTKEQKQGIRDVFKALFGGPRKAGGIASLDPGWDLKVVETDAEKAQMVEARKAQVAEIARYFGVPGHLIGIPEASQGYGKNLAELGRGFVQQTLEPWSNRVTEELRRKLMPARRGRRWFLEYDLSRFKKGDEESIARADEIDLRTGARTINQVKKGRGLPTVEGGDVTLVNGKPLDQVLNPAPPAPPAAEGAGGRGDDEDMMDGEEEDAGPAIEALSRHARRVKARTADLTAKKVATAAISRNIATLRAEAARRIRETVKADPRAITAALESVEHGVDPAKAAATLAA